MNKVLCICTGNYVRSHIAAAVLRQVASAHGDDLAVKTAGTTDWGAGRKIAPLVQDIVGKQANFYPHKVTSGEVEWANVILVMEFAHERFFLNHYPKFAYKALLISELVGEREALCNPHHADAEAVRKSAEVIRRYITDGYLVLQDRLAPTPDPERWRLRLAP